LPEEKRNLKFNRKRRNGKTVGEGNVTQLFETALKRRCIFCIMKEKLLKKYEQTLHGINQKVSTRLVCKKGEKKKKTLK